MSDTHCGGEDTLQSSGEATRRMCVCVCALISGQCTRSAFFFRDGATYPSRGVVRHFALVELERAGAQLLSELVADDRAAEGNRSRSFGKLAAARYISPTLFFLYI